MPPLPVTVPDVETALLADVSVDLGWELIERFSTLVRESGMPDEHTAADYIGSKLDELGVEYTMYEPSLYLSLPRDSSVLLAGADAPFRAKPPSFARSTPPEGITAEAVYLPAPPMQDLGEIFEDKRTGDDEAVRGKIVVTNGYAMPSVVKRYEEAGAVAQVYINPGRNIHWGICTTIWGTPTQENIHTKPRTPVVAISKPDGERIVARLESGPVALTVKASLEEGWYPCKLPVATIRGRSDDYLLVHGHYDSWDVGIGDNAVGDATLLELARIFHGRRDGLDRSLKIAWWPGHSTGRYAGSTWFADEFAMDLVKRCVAAVDIDSPGCWKASAFEDVMWMAEADALCRGAIRDCTGLEPGRRRPIRAGDYSFNQLGLTSFFMLLSNIPESEREELGFYPVGGCGGNIAWHTEDDTLDVADRGYLEQDLRVYVAAITRVLNAEVLPLDHRRSLDELAEAMTAYRDAAAGLVDFSAIDEELTGLRAALDDLYAHITTMSDPQGRGEVNRVLMGLSRILVPIGYARGPRFSHDPAIPLGVIPRLEDVHSLKPASDRKHELLPFLRAGVRRSINEVANALYEATCLVRTVT